LRQVSDRQFHRPTNWNASNAFVLVDPGVRRQVLFGFLTHGFQLFHALFRARFFVIASARHGPNYREHDYAKQCEEKHDP
jgi:hypothetical protein